MVPEFTDRTDLAYFQRNQAVILAASLAIKAGFKAGWGIDEREDYDEEWKTVVFIEDDSRQLSWHMCPHTYKQAQQLLPRFEGEWDGTFLSRGDLF